MSVSVLKESIKAHKKAKKNALFNYTTSTTPRTHTQIKKKKKSKSKLQVFCADREKKTEREG